MLCAPTACVVAACRIRHPIATPPSPTSILPPHSHVKEGNGDRPCFFWEGNEPVDAAMMTYQQVDGRERGEREGEGDSREGEREGEGRQKVDLTILPPPN